MFGIGIVFLRYSISAVVRLLPGKADCRPKPPEKQQPSCLRVALPRLSASNGAAEQGPFQLHCFLQQCSSEGPCSAASLLAGLAADLGVSILLLTQQIQTWSLACFFIPLPSQQELALDALSPAHRSPAADSDTFSSVAQALSPAPFMCDCTDLRQASTKTLFPCCGILRVRTPRALICCGRQPQGAGQVPGLRNS